MGTPSSSFLNTVYLRLAVGGPEGGHDAVDFVVHCAVGHPWTFDYISLYYDSVVCPGLHNGGRNELYGYPSHRGVPRTCSL